MPELGTAVAAMLSSAGKKPQRTVVSLIARRSETLPRALNGSSYVSVASRSP
jgi:hypothetical protein